MSPGGVVLDSVLSNRGEQDQAGCFLRARRESYTVHSSFMEGCWEDGPWASQGGKSRVTGSLGKSGQLPGDDPRAEHLALD